MRVRLEWYVPNQAMRRVWMLVTNMYEDGKGEIKGKDLDVELERSPVFGLDCVRLVWHAYGRAGPSTEYARDG